MRVCRGSGKTYHRQNAHLGITDESCCKQRQASAQAEGECRRCCGLVGVRQVVQVDTYQHHRIVSSFSIAMVKEASSIAILVNTAQRHADLPCLTTGHSYHTGLSSHNSHVRCAILVSLKDMRLYMPLSHTLKSCMHTISGLLKPIAGAPSSSLACALITSFAVSSSATYHITEHLASC